MYFTSDVKEMTFDFFFKIIGHRPLFINKFKVYFCFCVCVWLNLRKYATEEILRDSHKMKFSAKVTPVVSTEK